MPTAEATVTFLSLQRAGVQAADKAVQDAADRLSAARSTKGVLGRMVHLAPNIHMVGDTWCAYIPPFLPEHFDGDSVLAPYGGVYFPTMAEAAEYMNDVLADLGVGSTGGDEVAD